MNSASHQEPDVLSRPERGVRSTRRPTTFLVCLLCGLIAAAIGATVSAPVPSCTPDSAAYLNASRNLEETGGLFLSLTPIEDHSAEKPFASWPPLYPVVVAGAMKITGNPASAARLVQLASLALLALPLGLLTMRIAGRSFILPVLVFLAISRPQLVIASFVWTEPLFILWAYGSFALLVEALRVDNRTGHADLLLLFLAGTLAGVSMLTRYVGAVVIASGIVVLLIHVEESPSGRRGLHRIATYLAPAALPNLAWLIRNRLELGFFFGAERGSMLTDPQGVVLDALRTIWTDTVMPPIGETLLPRIALGFLGLLAVATLAGIALHAFGPETYGRSHGRAAAANTMTSFLILYVLAMVFISIRFIHEPVNTRLFAPIYPALLLLATFILRPVFSGSIAQRRRRLRALALGAVTILWMIQAAAAYRYALGPREDRALTAPHWRSIEFADPDWRDDDVIRHLLGIAPTGTLVLTNLSDVVSIWTDRPTKPLPDRDDPDWKEKIATHRRAVVLVHHDYRRLLVGTEEMNRMVREGRCWYLGRRGKGSFYRVRG